MVGRGATLHRIHASGIDAADSWIHLFDAAAAADVTIGTHVPVYTVFVPAGDAALAGAVTEEFGEGGIEFKLGIVTAVKTVGTSAGTTGPTTPLVLTAQYS